MNTESSLIIELLPIIGVLVGGFIALISTLAARYFGFKLEQKKDDRKVYKEKLERAYIVLSQIRHNYVDIMGQCHLKINYGKDFQLGKTGVPSPISEIAMLTNLYIPSLKESHTEFQKLIDSIGKTLAKVITTKENQLDYETKKNLNTEIASKMLTLEDEISDFQKKISERIQDVYNVST